MSWADLQKNCGGILTTLSFSTEFKILEKSKDVFQVKKIQFLNSFSWLLRGVKSGWFPEPYAGIWLAVWCA